MATLIIAAALRSTVAAQPPVAFLSPCKCRYNHGEHRTGIENNWFALTGRVVVVKVEAVRNIERQEPM